MLFVLKDLTDATEPRTNPNSFSKWQCSEVRPSNTTISVLRQVGCEHVLPTFIPCVEIQRHQVLHELLQKWRVDRTNKVLIFTKSVKLLNMLEFHLRIQSKLLFQNISLCIKAYKSQVMDSSNLTVVQSRKIVCSVNQCPLFPIV